MITFNGCFRILQTVPTTNPNALYKRPFNCSGGMTIAISNIELFLVVKTFPNLEESIGDHGVFWLYAGFILSQSLKIY